jgi:hypothetical protein
MSINTASMSTIVRVAPRILFEKFSLKVTASNKKYLTLTHKRAGTHTHTHTYTHARARVCVCVYIYI